MRISPQYLLALPATALFPSFAEAGTLANAFASWSAVMHAFGITWTQVVMVGMGLLLLFIALSALYAFVFRFICRKSSAGSLDFTLRRGTVFFALVPLLFTVLSSVICGQLLRVGMPGGLSTYLTIFATVGGTAWLARPLLLQVKADTVSFIKVLGITLLTFFISGLISAALKVAMSAIL